MQMDITSQHISKEKKNNS